METDAGGWTLFYSYNHFPGQDLTLDSSVFIIKIETSQLSI